MNAQELKNFLADSPPSAVNLEIKKHFEALTDQQQRYGKQAACLCSGSSLPVPYDLH